MCSSAQASFIAAGVVGGIGVLTIRKARTALEVPLASMPLLFGLQQLVEGVVWLSFQAPEATAWNSTATYVYSLFSHVLWPAFVPVAMLLVESERSRRRIHRERQMSPARLERLQAVAPGRNRVEHVTPNWSIAASSFQSPGQHVSSE